MILKKKKLFQKEDPETISQPKEKIMMVNNQRRNKKQKVKRRVNKSKVHVWRKWKNKSIISGNGTLYYCLLKFLP